MLTVDEVAAMLADRRLPVVSRATGLHYNTIANIRDGKTRNPGAEALKKLSDYLKGDLA